MVEGTFGDLSPNWLKSDVAPWQEECPSDHETALAAHLEHFF